MGYPASRSASVNEKSSLTDPRQTAMPPTSSKRSRRIAVPPPQQKLWLWLPRYVAIGAFQALTIALHKPPSFGNSQRNVVAAPTEESAKGAINRVSQERGGRPSESTKTKTSNSGPVCCTATRRLF